MRRACPLRWPPPLRPSPWGVAGQRTTHALVGGPAAPRRAAGPPLLLLLALQPGLLTCLFLSSPLAWPPAALSQWLLVLLPGGGDAAGLGLRRRLLGEGSRPRPAPTGAARDAVGRSVGYCPAVVSMETLGAALSMVQTAVGAAASTSDTDVSSSSHSVSLSEALWHASDSGASTLWDSPGYIERQESQGWPSSALLDTFRYPTQPLDTSDTLAPFCEAFQKGSMDRHKFLDHIAAIKSSLSLLAWKRVIATCADASQWDALQAVTCLMPGQVSLFNAAIRAHSRAQRPTGVRDVLRRMEEAGLECDRSTFHLRLAAAGGEVPGEVLQEMRAEGLAVTVDTLLALVGRCIAAGQPQPFQRLLDALGEVDCPPRTFVWDGLLLQCCAARQYSLAAAVRRQLDRLGVPYSPKTWQCLAETYSRLHDTAQTRSLYQRMDETQMPPTPWMGQVLVRAAAQAKAVDLVQDLLCWLRRWDVVLTRATCSTAFEALASAGCLEAGLQLAHTMLKAGQLPGETMLQWLVAETAQSGGTRGLKELMSSLEQAGWSGHNLWYLTTLGSAYARALDFGALAGVLQALHARHFPLQPPLAARLADLPLTTAALQDLRGLLVRMASSGDPEALAVLAPRLYDAVVEGDPVTTAELKLLLRALLQAGDPDRLRHAVLAAARRNLRPPPWLHHALQSLAAAPSWMGRRDVQRWLSRHHIATPAPADAPHPGHDSLPLSLSIARQDWAAAVDECKAGPPPPPLILATLLKGLAASPQAPLAAELARAVPPPALAATLRALLEEGHAAAVADVLLGLPSASDADTTAALLEAVGQERVLGQLAAAGDVARAERLRCFADQSPKSAPGHPDPAVCRDSGLAEALTEAAPAGPGTEGVPPGDSEAEAGEGHHAGHAAVPPPPASTSSVEDLLRGSWNRDILQMQTAERLFQATAVKGVVLSLNPVFLTYCHTNLSGEVDRLAKHLGIPPVGLVQSAQRAAAEAYPGLLPAAMQSAAPMKPAIVSMHDARALGDCLLIYVKAGVFPQALRTLAEMVASQARPPAHTVRLLAEGLSAPELDWAPTRKVQAVKALTQHVRALGMLTDEVAYAAVADALGRLQERGELVRLFGSLAGCGVPPAAHHFAATIRGHLKGPHLGSADHALQAMVRAGHAPPAEVMAELIVVHAKAGTKAEAKRVFRYLEAFPGPVPQALYETLLVEVAQRRDYRAIMRVLQRLLAQPLPAPLATAAYNAALEAFARSPSATTTPDALQWVAHRHALRVVTDEHTYALTLLLHCANDDALAVADLLLEMQQARVPTRAVSRPALGRLFRQRSNDRPHLKALQCRLRAAPGATEEYGTLLREVQQQLLNPKGPVLRGFDPATLLFSGFPLNPPQAQPGAAEAIHPAAVVHGVSFFTALCLAWAAIFFGVCYAIAYFTNLIAPERKSAAPLRVDAVRLDRSRHC